MIQSLGNQIVDMQLVFTAHKWNDRIRFSCWTLTELTNLGTAYKWLLISQRELYIGTSESKKHTTAYNNPAKKF